MVFPRVPRSHTCFIECWGCGKCLLTLRTDALKPQKQSLGLNLLFKVGDGEGRDRCPQWLPNQEAGLV